MPFPVIESAVRIMGRVLRICLSRAFFSSIWLLKMRYHPTVRCVCDVRTAHCGCSVDMLCTFASTCIVDIAYGWSDLSSLWMDQVMSIMRTLVKLLVKALSISTTLSSCMLTQSSCSGNFQFRLLELSLLGAVEVFWGLVPCCGAWLRCTCGGVVVPCVDPVEFPLLCGPGLCGLVCSCSLALAVSSLLMWFP